MNLRHEKAIMNNINFHKMLKDAKRELGYEPSKDSKKRLKKQYSKKTLDYETLIAYLKDVFHDK